VTLRLAFVFSEENAVTVATPKRQFISLVHGAERHDCSVKTLRRRIASGELRAYRLGKSKAIRVDLAELDALMQPIPTIPPHGDGGFAA
jgi:excisionase family DNA binding protein